jgi:gas vesicle protein
MDWEKGMEKLRDMIVGEMRQEFKEFKSAVTGELSGYRIALESLSARMTNMESELRLTRTDLTSRIETVRTELSGKIETVRLELSGKIDTVRSELKAEIDTTRTELKAEIRENTRRIDTCNNRIDALQFEFIQVRERLDKAISQKVLVEDLAVRVTNLEAKAA